MKKLKKESFGINKVIDVRTITEAGDTLILSATQAECDALAKRFDLPAVHSVTASGRLFRDDLIVFEGVLKSEQERICVVASEPFTERTEEPFRLVFSERQPSSSDINVDDDIILPVVRGKINLGEAIAEEFGVNLNPFPRRDDTPFSYVDIDTDSADEPNNPFSVLKNLTHKK